MKKYIKLEGREDANNLKVQVYYNKGGINYYNYQQDKRGYYVSVTPVKLEDCGTYTTEQYAMFSGVKQFILEVKRQSDKQYNQALEMINSSGIVDRLIEHLGLTANIVKD